jgi:hypothetical protein
VVVLHLNGVKAGMPVFYGAKSRSDDKQKFGEKPISWLEIQKILTERPSCC